MELTTHMTFNPDAQLDPEPPNLILISSDQTEFHVHRGRLLIASSNLFNLLLIYPDPEINLAEGSELVTIFLHCIYDIPFTSQPSPDTIIASFDVLKRYGITLNRYIRPNTPLFQAALLPLDSQEYAMELYVQAAQNNLSELAACASSALLSYSLATITDELARRMGPIYLKKLFVLHTERSKALRHILSTPPAAHPPTQECGSEGRRRFLGDWDVVTANMVLTARPGKVAGSGPERKVQSDDK